MAQRLLFFLVFILAIPQALPGRRVHDFANILPAEVESELERQAQTVEQITSAQLAIVTVASLENKTVDEYANDLFNSWEIGRRDRNNGVLFLFAPVEKRVKIEVGPGLEPLLPDSRCGAILDEFVIPAVKSGSIPLGIAQGTKELVRVLESNPEAARGITGSTSSWRAQPWEAARNANLFAIGWAVLCAIFGFAAKRTRKYSSVLYLISSGVLVAGVGFAVYSGLSLPRGVDVFPFMAGSGVSGLIALVYSTRRYLRFRPRRCLHCSSPLQLLDESKDDDLLTEVQKLEEHLGAVDYDVWLCPACLKSDVKSYLSAVSNYTKCPSCSNMTFEEKSTVLQSATAYSTGLKRVDGLCMSCKYKTSRTETIAPLTTSSGGGGSSFGGGGGGGSGGGGFGGGTSGGGGASRGW